MAVRLADEARPQQLHAGADGRHDVAAGHRVGVVHQGAVEGAALDGVRVALQRFVRRPPRILEQRRIGLAPARVVRAQAGRAPERRRVVDRVSDGLVQIGVDGVEAGLQRVDQGNVQAVLPDARQAVRLDAVLVPRAVGREHEVIGVERHLVAVDDGVRAAPFHDEAQRRRGMRVRRGDFAGVHHLQPRVQPADRRADLLTAGVVQVDDATPRLLGRDEGHRAQHVVAQIPVAPQDRHGIRLRLPGLDLVRHCPQCAGLQARQLLVVGQQLRGVRHVGTAGNAFPIGVVRGCCHRGSPWSGSGECRHHARPRAKLRSSGSLPNR